ncbi:MAG: hypothetical protein HYZ15_00885 [Sphingobacteriales bacterium]|nr:hypothetical protein [Sphingobacteriales bacterium]
MINFFQVLFFIAAIVLLVLNVLEFNKWRDSKKAGSAAPYKIQWFNFLLTSLVSLGCLLNIMVRWISRG